MASETLWKAISLQEGMKHNQQIGNLFFRIEAEEKELWIGHHYLEVDTDDVELEALDDEVLEWMRWSFAELPEKLLMKPYLPDKAMVVHAEYPQRILPGDEARIFIGVPATVRFELKADSENPLLELSSEKLSRTWFGDRLEGELCYWWSTRARRSLPEMKKENTRIGCPVKIINKSEEELYFEKFCHRVTRLQVYQYEGGLWTEETQITYKGEEDLSDVTVLGRLPLEFKGAEKISPAREEARRSLAVRTFLSFI